VKILQPTTSVLPEPTWPKFNYSKKRWDGYKAYRKKKNKKFHPEFLAQSNRLEHEKKLDRNYFPVKGWRIIKHSKELHLNKFLILFFKLLVNICNFSNLVPVLKVKSTSIIQS